MAPTPLKSDGNSIRNEINLLSFPFLLNLANGRGIVVGASSDVEGVVSVSDGRR